MGTLYSAGFALSKMIAEKVKENPKAECCTDGETRTGYVGGNIEACYHQTLSIIQEAEAYIEQRVNSAHLFGGSRYSPLPSQQRKQIFTQILPLIRGWVSRRKKSHCDI